MLKRIWQMLQGNSTEEEEAPAEITAGPDAETPADVETPEALKPTSPLSPPTPRQETEIAAVGEEIEGESGLSYGLSSHIGRVRAINQDAAEVFLTTIPGANGDAPFGLFIVADGMGGHYDGERASAIAVRALSRYVITHFLTPVLGGQESGADSPSLTEVLEDGVVYANSQVCEQVPEGGTTLTGVAMIGSMAYVAHVGDSRAYLIRNGKIRQLTVDHTWAQEAINAGRLTPEEARQHPNRNVIKRYMGIQSDMEVDFRLMRPKTQGLPPGKRTRAWN